VLTFALAALVLAAAEPTPPADRANALSFENGALLVSDGGSYATGIAAWSAWYLADGDERAGWCSPQGKPTGVAFVWDLDTAWRLDALAVSNRNVQEDGYPGISVRRVDLWVDPGTGFVEAGRFELGKGERKEFPLPKGTAARRVKLVIAANHGHAEYTEVAEVELFGERTGKVEPARIAGDFETQYGRMRVVASGEEVYGCYEYVDGATIEGTLIGRNARVTWFEPGDRPRQGTATFIVWPDGERLAGVWYEDGKLAGEWNGARAQEPTRCTPRKRDPLQALRRQKRLVLYGIRFDSGRDVPRPESAPTLDELAGMLKKDAALRVLVEGHTDSTNTAAFNLDLSQRRAQKVVAALVTRGVDAGRLQAKGFGPARPVADNASAQGRALNRRVEVSIAE
jgi:outer membrane protein OmpA-like peptidoglycan-associated protein